MFYFKTYLQIEEDIFWNAIQFEHSVDFTFNPSNISQNHLQTIIFALIMIQQDQITSLDDRLDALRRHL